MLFAIAALIFVTVFLLFYIFILSGATHHQLEQRFKTAGIFSSYADYTSGELSQPLYYRLFHPLMDGLDNLFNALTPKEIQRVLADKLKEAGLTQTMTVRQFVLRWGLVNLLLMVCSLFLSSSLLELGLTDALLNMLCAFLVGLLLPWLVLKSQITKRKNSIQRFLSDVIDLLLVSIQAGTSFDGAIVRVTQQMKGTFADELSTMLQQIRLGVSRHDALRNMADRCQVPDVSLLVSALIQADRLGVSIAQILEVQAQMLRKKRVLRAREQAMKAPVKLIFPLVLFLLPVIFMAILAPVVVQIMRGL